jgi:hypothetical protein
MHSIRHHHTRRCILVPCRADLFDTTTPGAFTFSPSVVSTGLLISGSGAGRDLFEDALERTRRRYRFVVTGYVVMPEHVHLLIGEPVKSDVAGAIHV